MILKWNSNLLTGVVVVISGSSMVEEPPGWRSDEVVTGGGVPDDVELGWMPDEVVVEPGLALSEVLELVLPVVVRIRGLTMLPFSSTVTVAVAVGLTLVMVVSKLVM